MNRPETIEETAALVDEAGGRGIAIQVDHLVPDQVRDLVNRIRNEQGSLHILVNDIWGATRMRVEQVSLGNPRWSMASRYVERWLFYKTGRSLSRATSRYRCSSRRQADWLSR